VCRRLGLPDDERPMAGATLLRTCYGSSSGASARVRPIPLLRMAHPCPPIPPDQALLPLRRGEFFRDNRPDQQRPAQSSSFLPAAASMCLALVPALGVVTDREK
jgi:hypothetical protein